MKRFLTLLLLLLMLVFIPLPATAAENQVVFTIGKSFYDLNEQTQAMDAAPFVESGRTYVPLRYLAMSVGVPVDKIKWNSTDQIVTLEKDGVTITLAVGSKVLYVNYQPQDMDVAPVIKNGRTYLPARYVAEALGYQVGWDANTQAVLIGPPGKLPKPKPSPSFKENSKPKIVTPTKLEAIKAFNSAHKYYDDSFGLVPDDVAEQRMIEGKKKIIESFPADWKCGLLVVRYVNSDGNFGCDFYPLIETQSGYYYGDYYLKGVEIKEVNWENIYPGNLFPVCMAEKNPVAIWRSSSLWKDKQDEIWNDNYWNSHGQYNDPDLPGAEWLPLN